MMNIYVKYPEFFKYVKILRVKYQWSEEFVKMETFLLFQTKQARHSKLKLSQPSEINNMRWVFALSRQSDIPNLNYQSHLYSTTE